MCWANEFNVPPPGEPAPEVGVFAPGCDQPTFTGTTYDIGTVASLASSIIVDALLIDEAERTHYEADYVRWQLHDADGSFAPKVELFPVTKRNKCPFCGA
jgi:hypothetical protein